MNESQNNNWNTCLVVFSGQVSRWWLKFLKKDFRHCFVTLGNGELWLTIDAMLHKVDVVIQPVAGSFDMQKWYEANGFKVLKVELNKVPLIPAPLGLFTCVEVAKRILGIHNFRVTTPYKLYKFLLNAKYMKIILDSKEQKWYI